MRPAMLTRFKTALCALTVCSSGVPAAMAADIVTLAQEPADITVEPVDHWRFEVTPYIWATGLSGDISPFRRAPTVHVDTSFSEIMENLNIAGFVNAWGTNGTFGFYADLMYVDTSESHSGGPVTIPTYNVTVPAVNVGVDSKIFTGTFFGAFRLADSDGFTLDALGGIRVAHLTTAVTAAVPGVTGDYRAESDFGWVDPALGLRAAYDFNDRFSLVAQGDIGGFSVGSDLTWQAMGTLNYQLTKSAALSFGYKYMSFDYDDDGHVFDTQLQGPTVGLTLNF